MGVDYCDGDCGGYGVGDWVGYCVFVMGVGFCGVGCGFDGWVWVFGWYCGVEI